MRGDRGYEERRKQEWILAEGLKTGTSANLEQRWSRLSSLRVGLQGWSSLRCSTLDRIESDFNLGLRVTGGLTFGPKPGVVDKGCLQIF